MKNITEIRKKIQNTSAQRDDRRAWWQVVSTIFLYLASIVTCFWSVTSEDWIGAIISCTVIAIGFARAFVLYHDCIHFSLFESRKTNLYVGRLLSIFCITPPDKWGLEHRHHHSVYGSATGELLEEGTGEPTTLTVEEYSKIGWLSRATYYLSRSNFAPLFGFLLWFVSMRLPWDREVSKHAAQNTIIYSIIHLLVVSLFFLANIKFGFFVLFSFYASMTLGTFLFTIQHSHEKAVVFTKKGSFDWDYSAFYGSSFLRFGKVFDFITGNIAYHGIHHFDSTIPNYLLPEIDKELKLVDNKDIMNISSLFECFRQISKTYLWDETSESWVSKYKKVA